MIIIELILKIFVCLYEIIAIILNNTFIKFIRLFIKVPEIRYFHPLGEKL